MRKAFQRFGEAYSSSPLVQDLVETGLKTGLAAGGQALFSDMTPEEIALAAILTYGAGMAGRPVGGFVGQQAGKVIDANYPGFGKRVMTDVNEAVAKMPDVMRTPMEAKLNPYRELGGASQYLNLLGRGLGDDAAQLALAFAAPALLGGGNEVIPPRTLNGSPEGELIMAALRGYGPYEELERVGLNTPEKLEQRRQELMQFDAA